jgi:hypothetical protein
VVEGWAQQDGGRQNIDLNILSNTKYRKTLVILAHAQIYLSSVV